MMGIIVMIHIMPAIDATNCAKLVKVQVMINALSAMKIIN